MQLFVEALRPFVFLLQSEPFFILTTFILGPSLIKFFEASFAIFKLIKLSIFLVPLLFFLLITAIIVFISLLFIAVPFELIKLAFAPIPFFFVFPLEFD